MEDGLADLLDVDDLLFDFAGSYVGTEDPLFGQYASTRDGVSPGAVPSATAVDDLRRSSPSIDGTPSPSSAAAPDAAADSRTKRKAEQNKCVDPRKAARDDSACSHETTAASCPQRSCGVDVVALVCDQPNMSCLLVPCSQPGAPLFVYCQCL